jgi:ribosomal-protein-alanine N-acetyltransferase
VIIFETERLLVRQFTLADKENFFRMNSHPRVMEYIRPVKNQEETDHFLQLNIEQYSHEPLYGRWAVIEKVSGLSIGSFAIIPVEDSGKMQLGYALMPEFWRKGYATELTMAGLKYIFTKTSLEVIYAITEQPNTASQNVLYKAGFKPNNSRMEEGKLLLEFVIRKGEFNVVNG